MTQPNPSSSVHEHDVSDAIRQDYWKRNVRIVLSLLAVWAVVSFGLSIALANFLNQFRLPLTSYPLGFWFAQQGSIVIYVLLVFTYVLLMNRLEHEEGMD